MLNKSSASPAQFKADFEQRIIEGYASIFGNVDSVGDVVMPGAFRKTLQDRMPRQLLKSYVNHVPPLLGHLVDGTAEDSTGLFTRISVTKNAVGTATLQDVMDGHLTHMSFAYDVIRRDFIQPENAAQAPIRHLQELKLYEAGPVDFPANEQAALLSAKAVSEALGEALAGLPELERVWHEKGFLSDRQRDVHHHLTAAIANAIAAALKTLTEAKPESSAVVADAATTTSVEPSPNTETDPDKSRDPEEGLYGVAFTLSSLKAQIDAHESGFAFGR